MSVHFTHAHPRARKPHTCTMCGRRIDAGETYHRGAGMDGSHAWTFIECAHCAALVKYVFALDPYEDEYYNDLFHEWEPETVTHLRLKVLATRRHWRHHDGSLYPVPEIVIREDRHGFGWPVDIRMGAEHEEVAP